MPKISNDWLDVIGDEFKKEYYLSGALALILLQLGGILAGEFVIDKAQWKR